MLATLVPFAPEADPEEEELLGALVELVDVAEFGLPPSAALEVPVVPFELFALVLVEEGRTTGLRFTCCKLRPARSQPTVEPQQTAHKQLVETDFLDIRLQNLTSPATS